MLLTIFITSYLLIWLNICSLAKLYNAECKKSLQVLSAPALYEVKWSDMWQVWWPILGTCALHLTHPSAHTHSSEHTAAPREQLGVGCLAQGSHLSRGIEGGESAGYSVPPPTIPGGPETQTRDLGVTSPTLSIRPRLTHARTHTTQHNTPHTLFFFLLP